MGREIFILYFLILSFTGVAQKIIIQPPLISVFDCTDFYKLYTGTINNSSDITHDAKIFLEVDYTSPAGVRSRLADGILTGSPSLSITPGVTTVNGATYQNVYTQRNITFYDSRIEQLLKSSKCIPPGDYDVCLTMVDASAVDGTTDFLTQTCYIVEKQMLSNLFLVSPFEEEEVILDMPLFTWTPVTPINPGAKYRIQIVELLANQTPFEAFRSNPIFFEQSGLMSNIFQYPVRARIMLPCTRYAWRVSYELDGSFVSGDFLRSADFLQQSEIWEFHRPCDEEKGEEDDEIVNSSYDLYYDIVKYAEGNILILNDFQIRLFIDNKYSAMSDLSFTIEGENDFYIESNCCWVCCDKLEDIGVVNAENSILKYGKQKLMLNLNDLNIKANSVYKLTINLGSEISSLKFKVLQ